MLASSLLLFLGAAPCALASPAVPPFAQEPEQQSVPLRLEDVVVLVGRNAPALRQARLLALSGEGGVLESGGMFDPVFFADLTYSYLEQPTSGFFSTLFAETETTTWTANQGLRGMLLSGATYEVSLREQDQSANFLAEDQADVSLNLSFTQPLLRGGWELVTEQQRRTAEIGLERSYEGVRLAATDTVQAAVDAYWDLAFAIEDLEVKRFGLNLADEQKSVTEARFRVGSVAEVEVVQTEAEIASRRDALLTAENTVRQAQDRLRLLISDFELDGDWQVEFVPISELPQAAHTSMQWQDALLVALEQRPDVRQARLDVTQAELDWQVAQRNSDPRLDFVVSGNSFGQDTRVLDAAEPVGRFDFPGYSIGLVFELPLGNRQYAGAEKRTWATYLFNVRSMRDLENTVASEVRDAVRAVNFFADRVAATEQATAVAGRQLEAEQRRLREGVSTNFRVLEFQNDFLTAKSTELSARMSYAKAVTKLNTVQGLRWDGVSLVGESTPDAEQEAERQEEENDQE